MEYAFELKVSLSGTDCDANEIVDRLGAAGCDGALVGVGSPGRISLSFVREAESAEAAVLSALADVNRLVPSARLIEVGPDFVGLTDVAELIGMSRQNIRKLMLTHATTFPPPVHVGSASIWHLALVLQWLQGKGQYRIPPGVLEVARVAMSLNIAKEGALVPSKARSRLCEFMTNMTPA